MNSLVLKYLVAAGIGALGAVIPLLDSGALPPELVFFGPVLSALAVALASRLERLGGGS